MASTVTSAHLPLLHQMLIDYFTVRFEPKAVLQKQARAKFWDGLSKFKMAKDFWHARKLM